MSMCRVYVGGLHGKTRERDVEKFFQKYGRLREILLKNGYGFVEFDDERDAEDACHDLDGKELLGERLRVEMARGKRRAGEFGGRGGDRFGRRGGGPDFRDRRPKRFGPPSRTTYRLYVENLSSSDGWQDLKDIMRKGGEVTFADKKGQHDGIVEFATRADMKNALKKCDGMDFNGRRLKVSEDKPSRSRSRSVSRSRSRSRSAVRGDRKNSGGSGSGPSSSNKDRKRSETRSRSRSVSRSRSRS